MIALAISPYFFLPLFNTTFFSHKKTITIDLCDAFINP